MPSEIKHYNIPIFIPEMACPYRCIYCNQQKITGFNALPDENDIKNIVETHLKTIDYNNAHVEIAFFGGNFTGISFTEQERFLSAVQEYIKKGQVKSIRISTRPDYINKDVLNILRKYKVKTIELGVQSMDDEVLRAAGREYTVKKIIEVAELIKSYDFDLCMQMMTGLPTDTLEKSLKTARSIIRCGASMTRIYPLLVIKDTPLEDLFSKGLYKPLSLTDAVLRVREIYKVFFAANVTVLKMGLHPSEDLMYGDGVIAGPFHTSFAEMVFTSLWQEKFALLKPDLMKCLKIFVNAKDYNHAIGYMASNKKMLTSQFKKVKFEVDNTLERFNYYADYS